MTLSLGIDTGGTYTDAVLYDGQTETVIAKAKAQTTRNDLAVGLTQAANRVLEAVAVDATAIELVSISTTLATNALVEGHGGRVALVMIGFDEADLDRGGLRSALGDDPIVFIKGGHSVHGKPNPFELEAAKEELLTIAGDVSAFAVAGYFSVRNPEHECAVREFLHAETDLAVTCSHELSAKLDGPKRALTTLLNARLIGMITQLIDATRGFLQTAGINAPLMVVRGDGSLVCDQFARSRPIETILSGPAASLVGAAHLVGTENAIVADIGGTTTDIAMLHDGRPRINDAGATVGGFQTMVDAVAMRTFGLAGDSEVWADEGSLHPEIHLGPRRFVPLSMAAVDHGPHVKKHLERQLRSRIVNRLEGRFAMLTQAGNDNALSRSQVDLLSRLTVCPQPLDLLLQGATELATLNHLVKRGLAQIAGFTPSDAQHVLGQFSHWDRSAAILGAELFARRKDGYGKALAETAEEAARRVVARLVALSAEAILETALVDDGLDGVALARAPLAQRALNQNQGTVQLSLALDRPVVGLGAAANAYYPAIAQRLNAACQVPDHADVANAIGAVVGQVRITDQVEINVMASGQFVLSGTAISKLQRHYECEDAAIQRAKSALERHLEDLAHKAGANSPVIHITVHCDAVDVDGQRQFLSATVSGSATGRPSVAQR